MVQEEDINVLVDESSIIWRNTALPNVHYHSISDFYYISIFKPKCHFNKKRKYNYTPHLTKQWALDAMLAFRLSHETPVKGNLKGVPIIENLTRDKILIY